MAPRRRCPPGVLCLSNSLLYLFVVVGLLVAASFLYLASRQQGQLQQQQQVADARESTTQATNIFVERGGGGDDRYTRAPEPLRIWNGGGLGFSTTSLPFNISTRPQNGYPDTFTSFGIITTEDGQALPLYGRRSAYSSDRYNYYTRTDTYNPVPLPLKMDKRDCMEDTGCPELFSKDKVHITAVGKDATAQIFKFDAPKYVPTI